MTVSNVMRKVYSETSTSSTISSLNDSPSSTSPSPATFESMAIDNQQHEPLNPKKSMTESSAHGTALKHVIFLDWDDTLMPTSYLLSFVECETEQDPNNCHVQKIKSFTLSNKLSQAEINEFISALNKAGQFMFNLLTKVFMKFKSKNVKIITNGAHGWVLQSLIIAASLCEIYTKILNLIFNDKQIEIIYARNYSLKPCNWKTKSFDKLLWRYFNDDDEKKNFGDINIITIGDQWHDHTSIEESLTYHIYGEYISHHQIKLYPKPDCKYLCDELNYISTLLDKELLFKFHNVINDNSTEKEGLVLEFDGYNN